MAERITRGDVEHVAQLARLALDEDEIVSLTKELGAIVDYAAQVSALDTSAVPPRPIVPCVPSRRSAPGVPRLGARGGAGVQEKRFRSYILGRNRAFRAEDVPSTPA